MISIKTMRNLYKKSLKTLLPENSENSFFYLLLFCCCLLFSSFLLLLDLPPITMKLWNFLKPILNIGMPPHGTFYRRRRSAYFSRTALVLVVSDQVWPLTQFFLFPFFENSLIRLEGMTPHRGGETLFSSVPPSNSLVSVSDPRRAF